MCEERVLVKMPKEVDHEVNPCSMGMMAILLNSSGVDWKNFFFDHKKILNM